MSFITIASAGTEHTHWQQVKFDSGDVCMRGGAGDFTIDKLIINIILSPGYHTD